MKKPRCRRSVMAIGDIHFPWHSRRTLWAIYKHAKVRKPDVIVQMGDLYDLFSWSRFPRTLNESTPRDELKRARGEAEHFWRTLRECCPRAKFYQLIGNHDARPLKQCISRMPELEDFVIKGMTGLMSFDGITTLDSDKSILTLDDVDYHHGFYTKLGAHSKAWGRNCVIGHTHKGGVAYHKLDTQILWELNCGYAADRYAVPMGYMAQSRYSNCTLGYGWIDQFGPSFVPLDTEEKCG